MAKALLSEKAPKIRKFRWSPAAEKCIDLLVAGRSKVDIAKELKIHRNSILVWLKHPEFVERFKEHAHVTLAEAAGRRALQTSNILDRTYGLLDKALKRAEAPVKKGEDDGEGGDLILRSNVRQWGAEYRAWREQERIELGQTASKQEGGTNVFNITGGIHVDNSNTQQLSFKQFLLDRIKDGRIDPEDLPPAEEAGELVSAALIQALDDDPGVIDAIHEEDRKAREEQDV